jgi:hypothetical protein
MAKFHSFVVNAFLSSPVDASTRAHTIACAFFDALSSLSRVPVDANRYSARPTSSASFPSPRPPSSRLARARAAARLRASRVDARETPIVLARETRAGVVVVDMGTRRDASDFDAFITNFTHANLRSHRYARLDATRRDATRRDATRRATRPAPSARDGRASGRTMTMIRESPEN